MRNFLIVLFVLAIGAFTLLNINAAFSNIDNVGTAGLYWLCAEIVGGVLLTIAFRYIINKVTNK